MVPEIKLPENHKWTFVLLDKNTSLQSWWLKIKSDTELLKYLELTRSKYGRAFENFVEDKLYQPGLMIHGPNPRHANLTMLAYFYGISTKQSFAAALCDIASITALNMQKALDAHGCVYVNPNGGYNTSGIESGDFCHRKELVWPQFTEQDIKISKFPGGQHYYAHVGTTDVRQGEKTKFDTYEAAKEAAMAYLNA